MAVGIKRSKRESIKASSLVLQIKRHAWQEIVMMSRPDNLHAFPSVRLKYIKLFGIAWLYSTDIRVYVYDQFVELFRFVKRVELPVKTLSADGSRPQKMKVSQTMASFSETSVNQAFLEYAISEMRSRKLKRNLLEPYLYNQITLEKSL